MKLVLFVFLMPILVYADDYNRLFVESGTASSYLQSNWNKYQENYHPNYAFDDNPATAWVEGVSGHGEGEYLEWEVSQLESAEEVRLEIYNGYQKSKNLLAANGAAKEVELIVFGTKAQFQTTRKEKLEKKMGPQHISIKLPENHGLTRFLLRVNSVWPGKTYKDTCISDVKIFVKSKVPYVPGTEKAKVEKLRSWIKERLEAAKFFARQPTSYPFSSNTFKTSIDKSFYPEAWKKDFANVPGMVFYKDIVVYPEPKLLAEANELMRKHSASFNIKKGWQKLVVKKASEGYLPDGLDALERQGKMIISYFSPDELTFFEVSNPIAEKLSMKEGGTEHTETFSHHQIWNESGKLRAVSWIKNVKGVERGPYNYDLVQIMVYQDKKPLWYLSVSGDETKQREAFHFVYNSGGKISGVHQISQSNGEFESPPYGYKFFSEVLSTIGKNEENR